MTTSNTSSNISSKAQKEIIKIVPLYTPEITRASMSAPQLVYNNGPLLTAVQVVLVFWGSAWQQSPLSDTAQSMSDFFDAMLTSSLIDQLAEYNTPQQQIGHGSRIGNYTITSPDPGTSVADSAIQQIISDELANNNTFPQPTANTLYFVLLPTGTAVQQGGSSSGQTFCGYHDSFSDQSGQIYYAVIPQPDCSGCAASLATLDALTEISSHELCEAITDPIPGQGWYDQNNGEIGDICAWQTKQIGTYTVQKEWSNKANACV
ncbi:MAG TPA: hypothetical protein VGT44_12830 [Ktedonobacteraceae bacterium]|nr:hypothetical protein [Ktedonobacteraceae bacterium]